MTLQSEPLVSVVTPVYNTEKYLAECIESVLAQTYQNWEYIIVNNCSTDRSLEIAQAYARQDARIRLCQNSEFLSQMGNWNHSLRQISPASKYCKIVHADDWLFPECLAQMVAVAEAHPTAGLVGAYRLEEDKVTLDGLPYPSPLVSGRDVGRLFFLESVYLFGAPTSLLIRSDLIRSRPAFYNEANIHADQEVCFELLQQVDFGFVHQVLTFTRRHNEATTARIHQFNTIMIGTLFALKKYGPFYLSEAEYKQRIKDSLEFHYRFLAQQVFEFREKPFWNYQRNELTRLGYPFSWGKLGLALLREMSNIEQTVKRLRLALKKRKTKAHTAMPQDIRKLNIANHSGS